jgi:hypothetical protein
MSTSPNDCNAQAIEEFRANQGRVGGMFEHMPLLLAGRVIPVVALTPNASTP